MPDVPYAELQVTTNYSFLRGASHVEELLVTAKALGLAAIGVMISFCRLPSLNWNSADTMNCLGWPDSDGNAGLAELPFSPWQATQVAALARPSSAPAAAGAA